MLCVFEILHNYSIIIYKRINKGSDLSDISRNISPLRCLCSRRVDHRVLTEAVTQLKYLCCSTAPAS